MNLNAKIDSKTEEVLKKIIIKHGSYYNFMDKIISLWTKNEFLYDNIKDLIAQKKLKEEITFLIKNPYNYEIDLETLLSLNKDIFSKPLRSDKIIHKNFFHDIVEHGDITSMLNDVFDKLKTSSTVLDNYFYTLYKLYNIYPFENSVTIRLFTNIYLLQNEYLPFFPFLENKSDYYDSLRHDYYKFEKYFKKIFLENLDKLSELSLKV